MHSLKRAAGVAALSLAVLSLGASDGQAVDPNNPHLQYYGQSQCRGRVEITNVYKASNGANSYEYYVNLRERSGKNLTVTVVVAGFPNTVHAAQHQIFSIYRNAGYGHKFGTGTFANVGPGQVQMLYDAEMGNGSPSIRLVNCY
ncbi:hypothetical protein [Roseococcus sp. YIM B11640]|uniref:hypothetical protein n=1 Tax=Roseococcus sp. YIM B11640 TaxID=3133973 RepID=UPI003C7B33F1